LLQVAVKVLPQVEFDVARHVNQYAPLQEQEGAARQTGAEDEQCVARQLRPRHVGAQPVNGATDEQGDEQPDHHRGQYADYAGDEVFLVRAKIAG